MIGLSAAEIGVGMALGSILGLLVTYPAGALADRFGRKAVIVPANLPQPESQWRCLRSHQAADGTCSVQHSGAWLPPRWSGARGLCSRLCTCWTNAAAMSAYRSLSDSGYVLGPLIFGLAADWAGAVSALYASCVLLIIVALTFMLRSA